MTGAKHQFTWAMAALLAFPAAVFAEDGPKTVLEPDQKTKTAIRQLTREQDELQADLTDIISDQTDEQVIELLKKCRISMNDSIDLLELNRTGSATLAAQSDVIERIYQAAKKKYGEGDNCKKGSAGVMSMLRRMLGMESPSGQKDGGNGEEKSGNRNPGQKPGEGGQSGEGAFASRPGEPGLSDPNMRGETRTVPKSTGVGSADMPEEFRETLESYNQTLQQ